MEKESTPRVVWFMLKRKKTEGKPKGTPLGKKALMGISNPPETSVFFVFSFFAQEGA